MWTVHDAGSEPGPGPNVTGDWSKAEGKDRAMRQLLRRVWRDLGNARAVDNARRDADALMRDLAAVDALAARIAARTAHARAA